MNKKEAIKLEIIMDYGYCSLAEFDARWAELKSLDAKNLRGSALWILNIEKEITEATGEEFE